MFPENQERKRRYLTWGIICAILGHFIFHIWDRVYYPEQKDLLFLLTLFGAGYLSILLLFVKRVPAGRIDLYTYLVMVPVCWNISLQCMFIEGFNNPIYLNILVYVLMSSLLAEVPSKHYIIILILIVGVHFIIVSFHEVFYFDGFITQVFYITAPAVAAGIFNHTIHVMRGREEASALEKEVLLKEVHHRVKNNLQVISSLLNLQSNALDNSSSKAIVKESQSRIKSIALIHQLLYQTESFSSIDFSTYLNQLLDNIHSAHKITKTIITYQIEAENIYLSIDYAIPLGLIVNELAVNAYKYAFAEADRGLLKIKLIENSGKPYHLLIEDNGLGLDESIDIKSGKTFGYKLVKLLVNQINGSIAVSRNPGTQIRIEFPINENQK